MRRVQNLGDASRKIETKPSATDRQINCVIVRLTHTNEILKRLNMITFRTPYFSARQETGEVDGVKKIYHIVDFGRSAGVVLYDQKTGRVLLTRQFRHLLQKESLEIPGGSVDGNESFYEAAIRETVEETGYRPIKLEFLANYYPGLDNVDNETEIFFSTDFIIEKQFEAHPGEVRSIEWVDLDSTLGLIRTREIRDVSSVLGIYGVAQLRALGRLDKQAPEIRLEEAKGSGAVLTVVIPSFNEEENILEIIRRAKMAFHSLEKEGKTYKLLFVENGSEDGSLELLRGISEVDRSVSFLSLSRNFGYQGAIAAGISAAANSSYVAIMDGDLQDPPEILFDMFNKLIQTDSDVVYGVKRSRQESAIKKILYKLFYKVFNAMSSTKLDGETGEFCVMNKRSLKAILDLSEQTRFHRGLRAWVGYKQLPHLYSRDARNAGDPKFNFFSALMLAREGIFSFTVAPLRSVIVVGFLVFSVAGTIFLLQLASKILSILGLDSLGIFAPPPGLTLLTLFIMVMLGVIILILGVIAEYIALIVNESKRRPNYIVSEKSQNIDSY